MYFHKKTKAHFVQLSHLLSCCCLGFGWVSDSVGVDANLWFALIWFLILRIKISGFVMLELSLTALKLSQNWILKPFRLLFTYAFTFGKDYPSIVPAGGRWKYCEITIINVWMRNIAVWW